MKKLRLYSLLCILLLFLCTSCGSNNTEESAAVPQTNTEDTVETDEDVSADSTDVAQEALPDDADTDADTAIADNQTESDDVIADDQAESDEVIADNQTESDEVIVDNQAESNGVITDEQEIASNETDETEIAEVTPPVETASAAPEAVAPAPAPAPAASTLPPCPYPTNIWIEETTEYGLKIYVLYSTHTDIGSARWNAPVPENHEVFEYYVPNDSNSDSPFIDLVFGQQTQLHDDTGVFHGMHFVYPVVKIGNFAEGTIYKISAGGHFTNIVNPATGHPDCPNFGTGLCRPGTIN